ncbi:hypothetical protein VAPA_1c21560 [Variovorax paradoxus B4]|uniref:Uncharacterized protein n=1 Tax=Variovorax paradoxus B4 TaxID=1246301 RepID=T1XAR4_VARPD|nr:hypothetical protein VAPA_1c21560 [Variovorax paradoxus B4]
MVMVVIIRATNDPSAHAKAGGIMRAREATQTVAGKRWHDMQMEVYKRPAGWRRDCRAKPAGIRGAGLQRCVGSRPSVVDKELHHQEAAS